MPLCAAPEYAYVLPALDEIGLGREAYSSPKLNMDAFQTRLTDIEYGQESYPLWRPTIGRLLPEPLAKRYSFQLQGLLSVAGEGNSPQTAVLSFKESFHARFQELAAKRPFEMNADERAVWNEIKRLINVELYRSRQPVLQRQFGEVVSVRPGHRSVRWEGTGREAVDLAKFPGEFATYCVGQPFEAYVERDQLSMGVRQVFYVKRTQQPTHRSAGDNEDFARSLSSNKDLPVAELD